MKRSLRSWLWRVPLEREVDEELALHVEMRTRELVARGMDPAAARELALSRLGDVASLKHTMTAIGRRRDRDMRLTQWFDELRSDLKFAIRQLKGSPAFTLVATLTLALGIGANSAIFALVDATLLRPLPYGNPDRLVSIWEKTATVPRSYGSPLNMLDWKTRSRTFEAVAGFTPSVGGMVMAGADGNAETVARQWVTSEIFDVLGVRAIAGRTFSAEDEAKRANVAVMSEAFWRTRFNADPGVVGREIRLDGTLFTVVGIAPKDFQLLGQSSIWAVRSLVNMPPRARGAYVFQVVGRLKPGVSIEAAEADLGAVADGLAREYPQTNKGRGIMLERMHDTVIGSDLRLDVDALPGRRRIRAPHLLRQRRQPAARPGDGANARARGPVRARRRPAAHRPATRDREPGAGGDWRRARYRDRRSHPQRRALARSGGSIAVERLAEIRPAGRGLLCGRGARSSGWCLG